MQPLLRIPWLRFLYVSDWDRKFSFWRFKDRACRHGDAPVRIALCGPYAVGALVTGVWYRIT